MLLPLLAFAALAPPPGAWVHVPAFSRKYRTACSTCHVAFPKLNVLGEAFRLNGYRFPDNDLLLRRDNPVPLGEEPWRDLWPRAIWPGDLPAAAALALRIQNDFVLTNASGTGMRLDMRLPNAVYLLGAATLGEAFAAFVESEWSREDGFDVLQAKLHVRQLLPWLGERVASLWLGLQDLFLFTFADRQVDRVGRSLFVWQRFQPSRITLPLVGGPLASGNEFNLVRTMPAVTVEGLVGGRGYWAVGVAQGAGTTTADNNARKDVFYKLRLKLGGLGLDGRYGGGGGPPTGTGGQLLDHALILEHFGYVGAEPVGAGDDRHRAFGFAARALVGPLDAGVGYVWRQSDDPWGIGLGPLTARSVFGKAEYLVLPWVMASVKAERFTVTLPATVAPTTPAGNRTMISPGLTLLIRHNVRLVAEGEWYPRADAGGPGYQERRAVVRLDLAF